MVSIYPQGFFSTWQWEIPEQNGGFLAGTIYRRGIAGWYLLVRTTFFPMAPWRQLSQAAAFLRTYHYLVSEYLASSCFKSQGMGGSGKPKANMGWDAIIWKLYVGECRRICLDILLKINHFSQCIAFFSPGTSQWDSWKNHWQSSLSGHYPLNKNFSLCFEEAVAFGNQTW